ncbi:MAG: hypothetical protein AUH96_14975 [Nitrospirae bacterium 13_2_20CM_2_61_4]|nr:MAG: hypothetical protein AUH96_14975 [Nitrospirae bacterium 13_2_20CM_2_61_4]
MRLAPSDLLGAALGLTFLMGAAPVAIGTEPAQFGTPKGDEGTRIFKTTEHPNYSGQFRLTGQGTVLVGSMQDRPPWDHLDYAGKRLNSVSGRISIEVDERANTGLVLVEFVEGADRYRIVFDRFAGTVPYQDGGIATRVYEHGDSGNGDPLYPKTWLYLAGWGKADVFKNGDLLLKDYAAHFMVMERSRDPKTHEVRYPVKRSLPGGETDPAGMEIDLWVRSKDQNTKNFPPFETFIHLYWEEVTWR